MSEAQQLSLEEKAKAPVTQVLTLRQKLFIYPLASTMALLSIYLLLFTGDPLEALAVERLDVQKDWYELDGQRDAKQDQIDALELEISGLETDMHAKETRAAEIDATIKSALGDTSVTAEISFQ